MKSLSKRSMTASNGLPGRSLGRLKGKSKGGGQGGELSIVGMPVEAETPVFESSF